MQFQNSQKNIIVIGLGRAQFRTGTANASHLYNGLGTSEEHRLNLREKRLVTISIITFSKPSLALANYSIKLSIMICKFQGIVLANLKFSRTIASCHN